ncbi:MAG: hypothetical protein KGQ69_00505 [Rhodospirillales bacterium]|nr:hypothetical protein [Rhodospirillales bacterium]
MSFDGMKVDMHIPVVSSVEESLPQARAERSSRLGRQVSFKAFILISGGAFTLTWAIMWIYIAALPMAYENRDYPVVLAKNDLIAECRPNEVAVFGDSRAVTGILPTAMNIPVENLAYPGASPIETYFFVRRMLRCPQLPRLVVLAHSASIYPKDEFFWTQFVALGALSLADIRSVESNATALGDDELRHVKRISAVPFAVLPELYAIHFPPLYFGPLLGGYVAARWRYNERSYHEAIVTSGHSSFGTANGTDAVTDEDKMTNWRVSPLVNLYLERTLALLAARHVPVIILTMPINASTCKRLPSVIPTRFKNYLKKVATKNPDVELVDPAIPCWPDRYYGDAWHFNMSGTLAYSHQLQNFLATVLHDNEDASMPHLQQEAQDEASALELNHAQTHDD